ncbi:hypothetical protein K438DRAFT_1774217 [Mycena galopus ATCC 62051]|nr:hypothetical protein K438DRAFT_1774217 [Mycena galopus ATCC 62051]
MFHTRFTALVVVSIATLSLGNAATSVNTSAAEAGGVLTNVACSTNPVSISIVKYPTTALTIVQPLEGTFILACLDPNYANCDLVPVVSGGCTQMPISQVNEMTSVQVPCGWVCTFYNTAVFVCDASEAVSSTTLVYPGSPNLGQQGFDNVVDIVSCEATD